MKCEYFCGNCRATNCKLWIKRGRIFIPVAMCVKCMIKVNRLLFPSLKQVENVLTENISWFEKLSYFLDYIKFIPAIPHDFLRQYWRDGAAIHKNEWEWWEALPLEAFMFPKILELE